MLEAYRARDWVKAITLVEEMRPLGDKVDPMIAAHFDLYAKRIAQFIAPPPPSEWDGVWDATFK